MIQPQHSQARAVASALVAALALLAVGCSDTATLSGVVTNPYADGAPMPGVRVEARELGEDAAPEPLIATTDADGEFEVEGLRRSSAYRVRVAGEGVSEALVERVVTGAGGDPSPLTLSVWPASALTAVVTERFSEAPVEGARVIAVPQLDGGVGPAQVLSTDEAGRWSLYDTRPGVLWEVEATLEGHSSAAAQGRMPAVGERADLGPMVIQQRPRVVAWVVHALTREPLVGCEVVWGATETTTTEGGKLVLRGVPIGRQHLEITCGDASTELDLDIPDGQPEFFLRERIEVITVPESASGLLKASGNTLAPLDGEIVLPEGLRVSLPEGLVSANLQTTAHGAMLPLARVDTLAAAKGLASSNPLYPGESVVWPLPDDSGPWEPTAVRAAPLTWLRGGDFGGVPVEEGYYLGVHSIDYVAPQLYGNRAGRYLVKKRSLPLEPDRIITLGGQRFGVARVDWPEGPWCVGRVQGDLWLPGTGCALVLVE